MHRIVPFVQVVTARLGIPTLILRFIICYLFVITIVSLWQAVDPTSAHNTNEMVDYGAEVMRDYLADSPTITYFLETAKFSLFNFITPWMLRYGIEASKYAIFYLLFTLLCTLLSLLFSFYLFIKYFWFPLYLFWGFVKLVGVVVWFLWVCFGRVVSGVIDAGVLVVEGVVLRVWRVVSWGLRHRWDEPGSPTSWSKGATTDLNGRWRWDS